MNKMNYQNTVQIMENVYAVGVKDWNRRLFDALIPLPKGTSYNSYLIIGNDKKALIDTVNPGFEKEWEQKISQKTSLSEIDYLIMNHAEPDHAGGIPYFMNQNKKAKLITSRPGAKMAQTFFDVPTERILAVKDKETIDLVHRSSHASLARNDVHLSSRGQNIVSMRLLWVTQPHRSVL